VVIDIVMPLLFLWLGWEPVKGSSTSFALFFLPFIFLNLYTLNLASLGKLTFRAVSFSQSAFLLQLSALWGIIFKQKASFHVTAKQQLEGNYLHLAYPHLLYILMAVGGMVVGITRDGLNASVATNLTWAAFNSAMFIPFITASFNFSEWRERLWRTAGKKEIAISSNINNDLGESGE